MQVLFDGIPLDKVSTSMTINAPAATLLLMYQLVGEKNGIPARRSRARFKRRAQGSTSLAGPTSTRPHSRCDSSLTSSSTARPRFPAGTRSRSRATTWPRLARRPRRRSPSPSPTESSTSKPRLTGQDVDEFAPRLAFFFVSRTSFLEEVAKFRAARRIWARVMKERFGAKNPKSMMLRFHTQTAGVQLAAQQPEVNLVRVAVQGLAAVMGGTQSLHTNSFDEAIALPTEKAARLACARSRSCLRNRRHQDC